MTKISVEFLHSSLSLVCKITLQHKRATDVVIIFLSVPSAVLIYLSPPSSEFCSHDFIFVS